MEIRRSIFHDQLDFGKLKPYLSIQVVTCPEEWLCRDSERESCAPSGEGLVEVGSHSLGWGIRETIIGIAMLEGLQFIEKSVVPAVADGRFGRT